jgi:PhzF family phenazine biosynthesis protein
VNLRVEIVNSFVDDGRGGNPAGIVLDAPPLSPGDKLRVSALVGVSETAFVLPSQVADYRLEFFTPTRQIAHCGHATIATFCCLQQLGKLGSSETSKETIDGTRDIVMEGDMAFMEQVAPKYTEITDRHDALLASLRLSKSELMDGHSPVIVNTGNAYIIVPLRSSNAVAKADPDFRIIEEISGEIGVIGYYLFSRETTVPGRDAGARMFAPRYGIREESATGTAAGPLGCYLHDRLEIRKKEILIEQGHFMTPPSPSIISVRLVTKEHHIKKVMVGGRAKAVRGLTISL